MYSFKQLLSTSSKLNCTVGLHGLQCCKPTKLHNLVFLVYWHIERICNHRGESMPFAVGDVRDVWVSWLELLDATICQKLPDVRM